MRTDPNSAALDGRVIEALRTQATRDPKGAMRQAAVQFESLFMQSVLKSMRDATMKAHGDSAGADTFSGMLDSQLARQFAGRPQGLADMLEKQLARHMQNLPALSPANQVQPLPAAEPAAAPSTAAPSTAAASAASFGERETSFIRKMLPHAQEAERQTGVPAAFILGQAALESGWGRAETRNSDGTASHNLFGIKATAAWKGASTAAMTTEYQDDKALRQRAAFRSYGSYGEAFADYARLVGSDPRYSAVVRGAATPESFAGGMQRAGYATDPNYAAKLARTINHTLALQRAIG